MITTKIEQHLKCVKHITKAYDFNVANNQMEFIGYFVKSAVHGLILIKNVN